MTDHRSDGFVTLTPDDERRLKEHFRDASGDVSGVRSATIAPTVGGREDDVSLLPADLQATIPQLPEHRLRAVRTEREMNVLRRRVLARPSGPRLWAILEAAYSPWHMHDRALARAYAQFFGDLTPLTALTPAAQERGHRRAMKLRIADLEMYWTRLRAEDLTGFALSGAILEREEELAPPGADEVQLAARAAIDDVVVKKKGRGLDVEFLSAVKVEARHLLTAPHRAYLVAKGEAAAERRKLVAAEERYFFESGV